MSEYLGHYCSYVHVQGGCFRDYLMYTLSWDTQRPDDGALGNWL